SIDAAAADAPLGPRGPVAARADAASSADGHADGGDGADRRLSCRHRAALLGAALRQVARADGAAVLDPAAVLRCQRRGGGAAGLRSCAMASPGVLARRHAI